MQGAGPWYLIGPFDNKGLATPYPPEEKIDLDAHYPGKGEEAVWRKMDFADGQVINLKHFKQSDQCICYLYRRIDMPADRNIDVSLGSDDGLMVWLNGKEAAHQRHRSRRLARRRSTRAAAQSGPERSAIESEQCER